MLIITCQNITQTLIKGENIIKKNIVFSDKEEEWCKVNVVW